MSETVLRIAKLVMRDMWKLAFLKMKKLLAILGLIFLAGLFLPSFAEATEGWVIETFNADIAIPRSGKVRITETIVADFGAIEKHGIYRTIETTDMKFKLLGVEQDGAKAITKVSSVSKGKEIRIGDPDQTITGRHTYEIAYEVGKVITRFDDHDELYWDVTGHEWRVHIEKATATVSLEGGQIQDVTCYTGPFGSKRQDCRAWIAEGKAYFETTLSLGNRSGLTIANRLPKNLIGEPFYPEDILKPLWMIFGSVAAIAFVLRRWWRHGRDMWYRKNIILNPEAEPETKPLFAKEVVVVEFDPPFAEASGDKPSRRLRPAEVGTLIDERVDIHDISATIVDLAVRGYLKIGERKKGRKRVYWFEKLKDFEGDLPKADLAGYEKEVLRGLFKKGDKAELDDLKNKFYKHLEKIRNKLYKRMEGGGYFVRRPDNVTKEYIGKGIVVLLISFFILSFSEFRLLWLFTPPFVLGVLLIVFSFLMPKKTAKGTEAIRRASGFKLFISKAEKHHQQFNERINRFDEFLPYAMVFGVVDKWVKVYQKLGVEPPQPDWYVAPYAFNAVAFSSSMRGMSSSFASTLPSTPAGAGGGSGFGGGGFSGGGFGGGGGGGW